MVILGIETSCDETAAAVLQKEGDKITVLSNVIASSASLQSKFGGIIPEQAAREQLKAIIPVIQTAIEDSGLKIQDLDAVAVTYGPGLIGSLLVGVETAKTLALVWNKPLIPVNHLVGHFYANWIDRQWTMKNGQLTKKDTSAIVNSQLSIPNFPVIGLLVSGGHTDLVLFTGHHQYQYLGGTRDDAAGECFDKCAILMGLSYPGGPEISKLASDGESKKINLPKPMLDSKDLDFSFSGLKTAVANFINSNLNYNRPDLAAAIEQSIVEVLVKKTLSAIKKYGVDRVMIAGGVAANRALSEALRSNLHGRLIVPMSHNLCTDNAAMIASAAFFTKKTINPLQLQADPNLGL